LLWPSRHPSLFSFSLPMTVKSSKELVHGFSMWAEKCVWALLW
jgi:hypothetical protein